MILFMLSSWSSILFSVMVGDYIEDEIPGIVKMEGLLIYDV